MEKLCFEDDYQDSWLLQMRLSTILISDGVYFALFNVLLHMYTIT